MSGSKTIKNTSNVPVSVVLRGRRGTDPSGGSLPPVSGIVAPEQSITLQYGNDQNPYLNSMEVEENSNGSDNRQTFATTSRGGAGTLDNLLNTNSTLHVTYNASNFGFALSGKN
jgi:hypothetical protein